MSLSHADRPSHAGLGRPRRREQHEHEEDEQQSDDDGYGAEDREQGYELSTGLLGQFETVSLHVVDSQAEKLEI